MFFLHDKKIRKKLSRKLLETGKDFFLSNNIECFDNSPIKAKLDNINSPTNRDKLQTPFKILGLNLTDEEIKVISKRNDFLHGNNLLKVKGDENCFQYVYYVNLELNFLVNALILKSIGFSGPVKNLAKILLDYANLPELKDQDYFKKI